MVLGFVFVSGVIGLNIYISSYQQQIVNSTSIHNAELYSDALKEFRTIYTSEVVSRVNDRNDFKVTHDYQLRDNEIPRSDLLVS